MNQKLAELQAFLNDNCGANLVVDGLKGEKTRKAIIEAFRNREPRAITDAQIATIAAKLNCSTTQIKAFAKVESNGGGWDKAGLLKCLWERHYLWRRIKVAIPFLSDPKPGGYTVDVDGNGINDSWEKLARAALDYPSLAFECASFGKFQVMGAHWKALGYPSVWAMVLTLSKNELAHYDCFARYIEVNGLKPALRKVSGNPKDCVAIAIGYNGSGAVKNMYPQKIAAAFKIFR